MVQGSLTAAQSLERLRLARSCASRAYYAAYQAATALLLYAKQVPPAGREAWSHEATPVLPKSLPTKMLGPAMQRDMEARLADLYDLRLIADYQSERLGIDLILYREDAHIEGFYLYIPAYLPGGKDAYDYAVKLQTLEDTWNDQEPLPEPPINLIPEKSPEQSAVWQRLWEARDRKTEAASAVAEAGSDAEQQTALADLRAARVDEIQEEKEYNAFYQAARPTDFFKA